MTASFRGFACRVFVTALFLSVIARPASAGWVTFDFNNVNLTGSTATAQNNYVDSYMDGVLLANGTGMTVTVLGARPTNSYTGDGHVVGPVVSGVVKPLTLGTTEVANPTTALATNDTFIDTYNSQEITMDFSGGKIYGITFQYEIFPNVNCGSTATCTEVPDFKFMAGTTYANAVQYGPTAVGAAPALPGFTKSTFSTASGTETAWQLGPQSATYTFAGGVDYLRFVDWPVVIGVDNIKINTTAPVPEPASMLLLGSGLAAAYAKRRRDKRNASVPVA